MKTSLQYSTVENVSDLKEIFLCDSAAVAIEEVVFSLFSTFECFISFCMM